MSDKDKGTNRAVTVDASGQIKAKTDKEIVEENKKLEEELKKVPRKAEENMTVMLVEQQQEKSINFGVVGVGQCGSRIAENFYKLGYTSVAINTATQDLKYINIPESNKLLLDYALGGAAKDLILGKTAAEQGANKILNFLDGFCKTCEILILAVSGAGGTGSGSAETMIKIMSQFGKPISVIYILPLISEDTLSKHNSVQTLARLAKLAKEDTINSLIVVDNNKIETIHPGLSMADFWAVANKEIVETLHVFNNMSAKPSKYTSLDSMDFSKMFIGTSDCLIYGSIELTKDMCMEETAVAEAMMSSLKNGLLADGFDLKQARSAGVIVVGKDEILQQIPAINFEYAFLMLNKICNEGTRVYRGIYNDETSKKDAVTIYTMISGLGLPNERVEELQQAAKRHVEVLQSKEDTRAINMTIDMGSTPTRSAVDVLHDKIKAKTSAMGKLTRGVIDRRRK